MWWVSQHCDKSYLDDQLIKKKGLFFLMSLDVLDQQYPLESGLRQRI